MPGDQRRLPGARAAPTLTDLPAGVLQHIVRFLLQCDGDTFRLPAAGSWRGAGFVSYRQAQWSCINMHRFCHNAAQPCSALLQSAHPHPAWQPGGLQGPVAGRTGRAATCGSGAGPAGTSTAAEYEQQFGSCAGSAHSLLLRWLPDAFSEARCLQLASPQLHSLTADCQWDRSAPWLLELQRFSRLQRLSLTCESLSEEDTYALGHLPLLRALLPNLTWPADDIQLPALRQLETLQINCSEDVDAYTPALLLNAAWLGSPLLQRLVLRSVTLDPALPVPPGLVLSMLELGSVSFRTCRGGSTALCDSACSTAR